MKTVAERLHSHHNEAVSWHCNRHEKVNMKKTIVLLATINIIHK
jgi:hypothetical protein